jgi:hypothetical protein
MWCVAKITPEYIERMEHIIDLYRTPLPHTEALLCMDEKSKQLIEDVCPVIPERTGVYRHRDHEYERSGTRNIFVAIEPCEGHREVTVTDRRTKKDFGQEIKLIALLPRYAKKTMIHIVLDNLNTHFEGSLIEALGKRETKQLMKRIKFHYTPKHASWLNMAEIEIGILSRQCIRGRIGKEEKLKKMIKIWKEKRNAQKKKIHWGFTKEDARKVFKYGVGN